MTSLAANCTPTDPEYLPFVYEKDDAFRYWVPFALTFGVVVIVVVAWGIKSMLCTDVGAKSASFNGASVTQRDAKMFAVLAISTLLITAHILYAVKGFTVVTIAGVAMCILLYDFITHQEFKVNYVFLNFANVLMIVSIYWFIVGYSEILVDASDAGGFGNIFEIGGLPFVHFLMGLLFATGFLMRTCFAMVKPTKKNLGSMPAMQVLDTEPPRIYKDNELECYTASQEGEHLSTVFDITMYETTFFGCVAVFIWFQYLIVALPSEGDVKWWQQNNISILYVAGFVALYNFLRVFWEADKKPIPEAIKNRAIWNSFWTFLFFLAVALTQTYMNLEVKRDKAEDADIKNVKVCMLVTWTFVLIIPFMSLYGSRKSAGKNPPP